MAPETVDTSNAESLRLGIEGAQAVLASGGSIVFPTDTVYGIGCDAFSPKAVQSLLEIKGRGRHMPPPVLVGSIEVAKNLVAAVPEGAEVLMEHFWPGGLTIIFDVSPDVSWDLGDTQGSVALRMPDHPVALALLEETGPLAVSSANLTGELPALNISEAKAQFGEHVPLYFDGGDVGVRYRDAPGNPGSTIVSARGVDNGGPWRVIRHGVVSTDALESLVGGVWET